MFHPYGLLIGIAIVAGWSVAERIEPRVNKVLPWILVFGLLGARAYHVIDKWEYYIENMGQIVALWNGGLGIWGGVIGGIVGWWVGTRNQELETRVRMLGAIVTGLPLAQAIGRIGNGISGEFVEKVWIFEWWGVEAILDLFLFSILSGLRNDENKSKIKVGIYLVGYGMIRFVLEFSRVDNWKSAGLGVAQWVSLTSLVVGLFLWRVNVQD